MLVAIHQPNLAPPPAFWSKWRQSDAMILLDGVQYVRHGRADHYLNRCLLANGWCTIPVQRGQFNQKIRHVYAMQDWTPQRLYNRILSDYADAPHRRWVAELVVESVDMVRGPLYLMVNMPLFLEIGYLLGITAPLYTQEDLGVDDDDRDLRLVKLVKRIGGTEYLSGPKGPTYMRPDIWQSADIPVQVSRYAWPQYPRGGQPWQIGLSIVDALAWLGADGTAELIRQGATEEWMPSENALSLPK